MKIKTYYVVKINQNQPKECIYIYIDMPCMQGSLNTIQEHIFNENI